jgi:hypothetical protein
MIFAGEYSMPLINCPDCKKEISSRASTCPGCGAPVITSNAAADSVVEQSSTFQEPIERLKLHALGSIIMLIVGIVWIIVAAKSPQDDMEISGWLITIGVTWYAATKLRATPQINFRHTREHNP